MLRALNALASSMIGLGYMEYISLETSLPELSGISIGLGITYLLYMLLRYLTKPP